MLMRTPDLEPPRRPVRLFDELIRHLRWRRSPVRHGAIEDLSERLRADIGAPARPPTRLPGPFDY